MQKTLFFANNFAAICRNEFVVANFAAMDLPLAAAMRQIDMYNRAVRRLVDRSHANGQPYVKVRGLS